MKQTVFAQSLSERQSLPGFFLNIFWTWLLLLSFTVTNQSHGDSPAEDALNKPSRPIPAKRISVETARVLRILFVPAVLLFSASYGSLNAAIGIVVLTAFYNEGGGADHWITKNGCCAGFYATFELGATLVAGE
jgi:4-hydroxybenzoate polyprenyltransferase